LIDKGDGKKMMVLITYDVNTETPVGRKRLRQVAKQCVNYGQRVQNSVFECVLDAAKCREVQHKLEQIIDKDKDSLRFYYLGNNYKAKVEHIGAKPSFDVEGVLLV
jgi:CRISPR-associated protein Cas2